MGAAQVVRDRAGREYEVARRVEEGVERGYVASQDWTGLERVGSESWVRGRADEGGEGYEG